MVRESFTKFAPRNFVTITMAQLFSFFSFFFSLFSRISAESHRCQRSRISLGYKTRVFPWRVPSVSRRALWTQQNSEIAWQRSGIAFHSPRFFLPFFFRRPILSHFRAIILQETLERDEQPPISPWESSLWYRWNWRAGGEAAFRADAAALARPARCFESFSKEATVIPGAKVSGRFW